MLSLDSHHYQLWEGNAQALVILSDVSSCSVIIYTKACSEGKSIQIFLIRKHNFGRCNAIQQDVMNHCLQHNGLFFL